MRIAIVDDISEERTLLRNRLESQFSRRNVHVDIFEYENGETFLTAAKECPFTVVFLDIYMNGSNGIDTAKELRRSDTDCLLVFTTTSTDHALEGFQPDSPTRAVFCPAFAVKEMSWRTSSSITTGFPSGPGCVV